MMGMTLVGKARMKEKIWKILLRSLEEWINDGWTNEYKGVGRRRRLRKIIRRRHHFRNRGCVIY